MLFSLVGQMICLEDAGRNHCAVNGFNLKTAVFGETEGMVLSSRLNTGDFSNG